MVKKSQETMLAEIKGGYDTYGSNGSREAFHAQPEVVQSYLYYLYRYY